MINSVFPLGGVLELGRGIIAHVRIHYFLKNLHLLPWPSSKQTSCLFVLGGFHVPLESFHSYGDVNITSEGLQILTYARHSWPLCSEGSLACHTYCDTGHPFIMVISEDL